MIVGMCIRAEIEGKCLTEHIYIIIVILSFKKHDFRFRIFLFFLSIYILYHPLARIMCRYRNKRFNEDFLLQRTGSIFEALIQRTGIYLHKPADLT